MTGKMTSISDVLWVITVLHSTLSTKPTLVAMPFRGRSQYVGTLLFINLITNLLTGPQHIAHLCGNYRRAPLIWEHRHRPPFSPFIRSASNRCAHHRQSPILSTLSGSTLKSRHSRRPVLDKTDWNWGFRSLYLERETSNPQSKFSDCQGMLPYFCVIPLFHSLPGIWNDAQYPISQSHKH